LYHTFFYLYSQDFFVSVPPGNPSKNAISANIFAMIRNHNIWCNFSFSGRHSFPELRFFHYLLRIFAICVEQIVPRAYNKRSMDT